MTAMTLVEYAKGLEDMKSRAIVEMFAMESDILMSIPFMTAPGGVYRYQEEQALPSMAFRAINETPALSSGVINDAVERCFPMAGNLDVDRVLLDRYGMERRSREENMKVKAATALWTTTFLDGDNASTPREFTGIKARLVGSTVDGTDYESRLLANATGSGGAALSLAKLDQAISLVANPTHLIMSRDMRTKFQAAARNSTISGHQITIDSGDVDPFKRPVTRYAGLPILVGYEVNRNTPILAYDEVAFGGGSAVTTSIYVVSFREGGVCGLQTKPMEVTDMGLTDGGVFYRTNVQHDVGLCIEDPFSALRLSSITNAAITA